MSRRKQIVIIISAVFLGVASVPAGVVGYFYLENQRMKTEMVKIVKDHHQLLLDYMQSKEIDPHHRVKTVTVYYDKTEHNPMGSIMIYGYVNGNKKYDVSFDMDKVDIGGVDKIRVDSADYSMDLLDFLEGKSNE
ncbi:MULTISPECIES: DUF1310 family protein [Lacticaseibacillus]|uniref:DUF1310 family protein n=2 Tax=Lacticaseibacillus TaxID=2759736 RepID=A0AAN1EZX8_LACCA|nr:MULTISPECIES: DUF1310 family protein [Lacticaseibacillus]ARY92248.1 hypothetical protein BGL52_10980 [Lacticaseibacillus casei]KAB1971298.1 DUF1310 family protein [Lacticaseibacillus casei]WLV80156.1 DUF1310 family protein [Lacticaseibacillus sp. NCIMB 15473]WNX24115.1 DUF1310 family protein [Lacticaseibacillus casei]WNX26889.1 DUF1310 family protein [Lacticaseibacillus casei]